MSYKKGKDIKCPFDCLFHCMTRTVQKTMLWNDKAHYPTKPPEDFDKW